jgi:hypothetical protein
LDEASYILQCIYVILASIAEIAYRSITESACGCKMPAESACPEAFRRKGVVEARSALTHAYPTFLAPIYMLVTLTSVTQMDTYDSNSKDGGVRVPFAVHNPIITASSL